MAISETVLAQEIVQAVAGRIGATPQDQEKMLPVWEAAAAAIANHLRQNAEVPAGVGVSVDPNTGQGSTTTPGTVI